MLCMYIKIGEFWCFSFWGIQMYPKDISAPFWAFFAICSACDGKEKFIETLALLIFAGFWYDVHADNGSSSS